MEHRFGVAGTEQDGVFFTEYSVGGQDLGPITVEISRQNSNLQEVKARLAAEARCRGANAVTGFKYGQRKHKTWQLALTLKWDTESWYGEGRAVLTQVTSPGVTSAPAGWMADPRGRHELRYWDGRAWTEHVSDAGTAGVDPI